MTCGNLPVGASSGGGYIILQCWKDNKGIVSWWLPNKLKCAIKSTTAAEALSLVLGLRNVYIRALICDNLQVQANLLIEAIIDNKNLHLVIYSTKLICKKRLRTDIVYMKEMILNKEIQWKPTSWF